MPISPSTNQIYEPPQEVHQAPGWLCACPVVWVVLSVDVKETVGDWEGDVSLVEPSEGGGGRGDGGRGGRKGSISQFLDFDASRQPHRAPPG